MERAVFDALIDDLERLTTPLSEAQRGTYYEHLKRWPVKYFEKAVKTLVQTYRAKRFPPVAIFRKVLDHIEIEDNRPPPDRTSPYDRYPCNACNDTGFQIEENKAYKPGESAAIASFCPCRLGRRRQEGWEAYAKIMKRIAEKRDERREEPADIAYEEEKT